MADQHKIRESERPARLAAEYVKEYLETGRHLDDNLTVLADLALSEDHQTARLASTAIFTTIVERSSDSFDPRGVSLYNGAFARLIHHCRQRAGGTQLDQALDRFELRDWRAIFERAERLRRVSSPAYDQADNPADSIKMIIVLSRVTIGADVAIVSPIIQRFRASFPAARIVLVGNPKAAELFGGDSRLHFHQAAYQRSGLLLERLLSWLDLLSSIRELTQDLSSEEYLVVDPDSRLSQLGLLPVSPGPASGPHSHEIEDYVFFPSREYGSSTNDSLARLTSSWLDEKLGYSQPVYPLVWLHNADLEQGERLVRSLRRDCNRPVVIANFGTGENPGKRVGQEFECSVVGSLLQEGSAVLLDSGAGDQEAKVAAEVLADIGRSADLQSRPRILELNEQTMPSSLNNPCDADLVVWRGRLGLLAAMIGAGDLYLGYDSAGQHITAALGVPGIDIFGGYSSPKMLERWRPEGRAAVTVIDAGPVSKPREPSAILAETRQAARALLKRDGGSLW